VSLVFIYRDTHGGRHGVHRGVHRGGRHDVLHGGHADL